MCLSIKQMMPCHVLGLTHSVNILEEDTVEIMISAIVSYMLCCVVLYCTILYCVMLYCIVSCYAMMYYTILYYFILYGTIL